MRGPNDDPRDEPPEPQKPRTNTAAIVFWVLAAGYFLFAMPGLPASLRAQTEQGADTGSLVAFAAGYCTPPVILAVIGLALYKRPRRD